MQVINCIIFKTYLIWVGSLIRCPIKSTCSVLLLYLPVLALNQTYTNLPWTKYTPKNFMLQIFLYERWFFFNMYTHIKASRVGGVPHLTHGSWFFNNQCQTWFYNYQCQTFSRWHIISNCQFLSFLWWIKSKSSFAHLLINIQWRNHFEEF